MKTMNAVNAVQLFILVWTFTAVCRADDDDISVNCEDVTGTVGEEVTFSCSVSLKKSDCCIIKYKFLYPKKYNDPTIYREEFPQDSCEQRNSSTCRFSSTTVMTGQFRFFVQTLCAQKDTEFTVNITESSKSGPVIEDPGKKETSKHEPVPEDPEQPIRDQSSNQEKAEDHGFKVAVIAAAVSCFIIVIIPIIYKMKQNYKQKRNNNTVNVIKYH